MELLSDEDLKQISKKLKINLQYIGLKFSFKKIIPEDGSCYIINLDGQQRGGTHWTCLILKNKTAIYYDSFGLPMPTVIKQFCLKYKPIRIIYSSKQIQGIDSVLCGYYTIFFLYFITVLHRDNSHFGQLINIHNGLFSDKPPKTKNNDKIIQFYIRKILT